MFAELCRLSSMTAGGNDGTRVRNFRIQDVRELVDSFDVLKSEFASLVAELERVDFSGELPIDGGKKLYELLGFAVNAATKLRASYLDSKMAKMPEDRPSPPSRPKKK